MLRTRALVPSIRAILRCRPPTSQSIFHCPTSFQISSRRSMSNQDLPPQIPTQYFPQSQQPFPQYFPQPPQEPPSASSGYLWTISVFLLGGFVGYNVEQEPQTGKWTFICVPTDLYMRLGDASFLARRALIKRWAENHNLGKIEGMPIVEGDEEFATGEAKLIYPEDIEAMRAEHQRNPTPELERELAINDMFGIISRLLQHGNLNTREWGFGFWYATNGDYSKFAKIASLIEMFCNGRSITHIDALKILGSDDYFAFTAARCIADAALFHDAERLTAQGLSYAVPLMVYILTRKQSMAKFLPKVIASVVAMNVGFVPWIYRRAEFTNDEVALSMLVSGGFDPKASIGVLKKIEEIQKMNNGPRSSKFEWASKKPSVASRIKNLETLLPAAIELQNELKKAHEIFQKLTAQQQDGQQFDGPEKIPSIDEGKKDEDEPESG